VPHTAWIELGKMRGPADVRRHFSSSIGCSRAEAKVDAEPR